MDPAPWLPVLVAALLNIVLFAYFMGGVNAKLTALKESVDKMKGNDAQLAVLKERVDQNSAQIAWGTRQFENQARQILALSRGDRLPSDLATQPSRRRT